MAKTELKLKSKNAATGQDITTTLTYVNPTADSATLKTFGQKLNNLTTNSYVETDRVQTINVDTEEITTKAQGSIEIVNNPTITDLGNSYRIAIDQFVINGQSVADLNPNNLFGIFAPSSGGYYCPIRALNNTGTDYIFIEKVNSQPASGNQGTIRIAVPATDNYTASTGEFNITLP